MVRIKDGLEIPDDELRFEASRSGGPGGQHVNTTASRVTLVFDLGASAALSPEQKEKIRLALGSRISGEGLLRITAQQHRSQRMNRDETIERFVTHLQQALKERRQRRATRPSRSSIAKRIEKKKRRGNAKRQRGVVQDE